MRDRREVRSFGVVMLMIVVVSVATFTSCGGGSGGGGNDGLLCNQCGDSDGLCVPTQDLFDGDRPSFCFAQNPVPNPCTAALLCVRKLDSGQRRCFPADPTNDALDLAYRCDGARPDPSGVPTRTATPSPTPTASPTLTPSATGLTPTPTLTPSPDSTPAEETQDFDITITDPNDDDLPSNFSATVTYPVANGSFRDGADTDCDDTDDEITAVDDGNGTLTITVSGDFEGIADVAETCTFHLKSGQSITADALGRSVTPPRLSITIEEL